MISNRAKNFLAQMGPLSITKLSPNWACQMGPIHCPKFLLSGNEKEAFSRRNELPRGGLRSTKMPQEKNGENTDLKCDLVLCRNMDSEKGSRTLQDWKPLK